MRHEFGLECAHELSEGIVQNLTVGVLCRDYPREFFRRSIFGFSPGPEGETGNPRRGSRCAAFYRLHGAVEGRALKPGARSRAQVNMVNLSEHLSLTAVDGVDLDALTPLALPTKLPMKSVARSIRIQSRTNVPFLIENVSNRFVIPDAELSETEFINYILKRTGAGLLLDVTNVYTNSVNFQFDPYRWVDDIDLAPSSSYT